MTRYAVFLRGINVGGAVPVRMEDLRARLAGLGFTEVATIKASGNVLLEAGRRPPDDVAADVERVLHDLTSVEVRAFVRSAREMAQIVRAGPWRGPPPGGVTYYVTLLSAPYARSPPPPFSTPAGDVTVLKVGPREIFSSGRRIGNRPGFPNAYVEKWTGAPATSRNWTTVNEMADRCRSGAATPTSMVRRSRGAPTP